MDALNHRFQLLRESGTCTPELLQVITLLVANANQTASLQKEEDLSGANHSFTEDESDLLPASAGLSSSPAADKVDWLTIDSMGRIQEHIVAVTDGSLQQYARDVRHLNDLSISTAEEHVRQLLERLLRSTSSSLERTGRQSLDDFAAEQSRTQRDFRIQCERELELFERQLEDRLTQFRMQVAKEVDQYTAFMRSSREHEFSVSQVFLHSHRLMAASLLLEEEAQQLSANGATKLELKLLKERVRLLEAAGRTGDSRSGSLHIRRGASLEGATTPAQQILIQSRASSFSPVPRGVGRRGRSEELDRLHQEQSAFHR